MDNPDVIVVGAGPAGSAAAIKLAQEGVKVVLIDRGMPIGSKNLSGGNPKATQSATHPCLSWNSVAHLIPD